MRCCIYHTELVQNAIVHNFSRQIAFIQYSEPSKHAWTFSETVQKISKITYTAIQPVLTFDKRQIRNEIVKELCFNMIKDLLYLFFIKPLIINTVNKKITMCNLKKCLIHAAF